MRILLDENIPRRLKFEIVGHDVKTVQEMGWSGKKNGELLSLAGSKDFQVFITADKRLPLQQDLEKYPFLTLLMSAKDNRLATLRKLIPAVQTQIREGKKRGFVEIS